MDIVIKLVTMGKIKFIMVGCGGIANSWLPVLNANPDVELVAACDPIPTQFKKLKDYEKFADIPTFNDLALAFQEVDADATLVLTPSQYHPRYIMESIDNACHVISEKSFFTEMNQYRHLRAWMKKAEEYDLTCVVNQQYRFMPRIQAIKAELDKGVIGQLGFIVSTFCQNRYHFNSWWRSQNQDLSQFNWYVHHYDTMRFLTGKNPVKVRARLIRPPWSKIVGESTIFLNVTFEGGIEWSYNGTQEGIAAFQDTGQTSFTMYGSKGTLFNNRPEGTFVHEENKDQSGMTKRVIMEPNEAEFTAKYPPGWETTLKHFVESVKNGTPHPTRFEDNFYTMAIAMCARKSHEMGGADVYVKDYMGLDVNP